MRTRIVRVLNLPWMLCIKGRTVSHPVEIQNKENNAAAFLRVLISGAHSSRFCISIAEVWLRIPYVSQKDSRASQTFAAGYLSQCGLCCVISLQPCERSTWVFMAGWAASLWRRMSANSTPGSQLAFPMDSQRRCSCSCPPATHCSILLPPLQVCLGLPV